ncbi:hypothetical protein, partial [Sediminicola sp. 1XM1-17]|uniref:hypothetical protein n=1 Tax=Sediminicola sp. 1XM1-17 TaxID=3127702 RepID=UPI00307800A8
MLAQDHPFGMHNPETSGAVNPFPKNQHAKRVMVSMLAQDHPFGMHKRSAVNPLPKTNTRSGLWFLCLTRIAIGDAQSRDFGSSESLSQKTNTRSGLWFLCLTRIAIGDAQSRD